MAKIDSVKFTSRLKLDEYPPTKITAKEYAECFELSMNTAYDQLKAGADNIIKRHVTFYEPAEKRKGKELKQVRVKTNWVSQIKYHDEKGYIEIWWNPKILLHLVSLQKHFTSYQLKQVSALRSIYAWKLLELLTRFKNNNVGYLKITLEDFCESMGATEKQKENFNNIKRRIIEPAIKELTEKDGWLIEWEAIKTSRKVTALRFDFSKNPQTDLFRE